MINALNSSSFLEETSGLAALHREVTEQDISFDFEEEEEEEENEADAEGGGQLDGDEIKAD